MATPELITMLVRYNCHGSADAARKAGPTATFGNVRYQVAIHYNHYLRMARVSDVCITLAPPSTEPQQREILIDMLFGSGAPLLLVPANWNKPGPVRKAIVAWDGGALPLEAMGGRGPLRWLVDGRPLPPAQPRRTLYWQPAELGFAQLTVIDARGRSARATVRLAP